MKTLCALLFVFAFSLAGFAQVENEKNKSVKPNSMVNNPAVKKSIPILFSISRFIPYPVDTISVKTDDLSFDDPKEAQTAGQT